jgi:hypothetical protein
MLIRITSRRPAARLAVAAVVAAAVIAVAPAPPIAEACSVRFRGDIVPGEKVPHSLLTAAAAGGEGAAAAVAELRLAGPTAVAALLAAAPPEHDPTRASWERALDAVCAQRDCAASGLYWHTDLESAVAEAGLDGRPILSLRLLGRLDEDLSCANSRFFRTVLYADPEVAGILRERFVLHWESVRPVPRLTIDFGDGRRLEGTITGNSVHYVLDPRGRLVDALPGLYGPGMFLDRLDRAGDAASGLALAEDAELADGMRRYHRDRLEAIDRDLAWAGGLEAVAPRLARARGAGAEAPDAREAEVLTMGKARLEMPLVDAVWWASWRSVLAGDPVEDAAPFDWEGLAAARRSQWRLSDASRRLLLAKHRPADLRAGERVVAGFEELVGLDTVRNEYLLHAIVHRWLENAPEADPAAFTERLYDQLFLTPSSDPWLGLVSPDTYLALDQPLEAAAPPGPEAILSSAATMRRADGALR